MDVFQLMVAIRQIESSNNYSVKNSIGALGAYQIMRSNLASWSREALGRVVSESEFMNNPGIQDQIASYKLGQYYDKYGFDGAASMWFSGQSNPYSSRSDGGNTVQQYVNKVRGVLGMPTLSGTPQKATVTSGGGSVAKSTPQPAIDPNVLAQQYGFTAALLNSDPELKKVFQSAVAGGWAADKFQAAIQNTNWWKGHTKAQREYLVKSFQDPASFEEDRENARYRINDLLAKVGQPNNINNQPFMDNLIWGVLYEGWSDAELKFKIANFIDFNPEGVIAGDGGTFQNAMSTAAWKNGITLDRDWYLKYYRGIVQGTTTEQQALGDIRQKAAALFPAFKDQIMAGQNVMDIASPYIQGMGTILEVNPGAIDLFDPTIKSALNYKDPKTGVTGAKPLWQYEVDLRKDPRWLQTSNAREGLMGVAHKVAQDMGVLY